MSREDHTPGPWWTAAKYNGREMGCSIIAARTDAGPLPGNPSRGQVAFATAILNADARRCEANARLIAAAPDLRATLGEAERQIEYLHEKFGETGSGNAVLARIRAALAKADTETRETNDDGK